MRFPLQSSLSKTVKFQSYLVGLAVTFSLVPHPKSYILVSSSPIPPVGFLRIAVVGLELSASGILPLQSPKQGGTTVRPREINQLAEGHELLASWQV